MLEEFLLGHYGKNVVLEREQVVTELMIFAWDGRICTECLEGLFRDYGCFHCSTWGVPNEINDVMNEFYDFHVVPFIGVSHYKTCKYCDKKKLETVLGSPVLRVILLREFSCSVCRGSS